MEILLQQHSGELTILILAAFILGTLLIVVPQLLRASQRTQEMQHIEHMKALENGQALSPIDPRMRAAGRTTSLVPMVICCAAATVTCFLATYKSEQVFAVTVTVWAVTGLVSLAAITGGVALMGRLAQIDAGLPDEEEE